MDSTRPNLRMDSTDLVRPNPSVVFTRLRSRSPFTETSVVSTRLPLRRHSMVPAMVLTPTAVATKQEPLLTLTLQAPSAPTTLANTIHLLHLQVTVATVATRQAPLQLATVATMTRPLLTLTDQAPSAATIPATTIHLLHLQVTVATESQLATVATIPRPLPTPTDQAPSAATTPATTIPKLLPLATTESGEQHQHDYVSSLYTNFSK